MSSLGLGKASKEIMVSIRWGNFYSIDECKYLEEKEKKKQRKKEERE